MTSESLLVMFPVASIVEMHGLLSAPQHNGIKGVVVGSTSERLSIQLEPVLGPGPPFAPVQDIRLLVKPSNLKVVPESDGLHSLLAMGSWALNDRIIEMQKKMGTAEFNRPAYEALVKRQQNLEFLITKARAPYSCDSVDFVCLTRISQDMDSSQIFTMGSVTLSVP
jgi:hypothetical protein